MCSPSSTPCPPPRWHADTKGQNWFYVKQDGFHPSGIGCPSHGPRLWCAPEQLGNDSENKVTRYMWLRLANYVSCATSAERVLQDRISSQNIWGMLNCHGSSFFFYFNATWMILVYELIKWGLWKIQPRLSEVRALFCNSAGFKLSPAIDKKNAVWKVVQEPTEIKVWGGFLV